MTRSITGRVTNSVERFVSFRLRHLGVRVYEQEAQLAARVDGEWVPIGPRHELPVHLPNMAPDSQSATADALQRTALQFDSECPGTDIRELLEMRKTVSQALADAQAAGV